ncbi:SER THR protein phosphatase family protein [Mycena sanguinolenta]|uniref:SER THR protein phosphatase family protein n=1 Tax=Mycena sanguinolenta TaxID=230812 RepID=A0A8H6Z5R4_9AGAR|nr:SER THR protein phosphatase family protein [Mycena sanguinolenta]
MWSWMILQSLLAAAALVAGAADVAEKSPTSSAKVTSLKISSTIINTPVSAFTAPGSFPTSMFTKYYNDPKQTASQVQPVIKDPVETNVVYPLSLTSPDTIPTNDTVDPHPLPPTASSSQLFQAAFDQIIAISTNPIFGNNSCARCQAGLEVAKFLAMASPESGPELAVQLCFHFNFNSACGTQFSRLALGSVITQVIANANVGGYDGQMLCQNFLGLCPLPPASPLNLTSWFAKPKPDPLPAPKTPSGKRLKVLHLSDIHIDPRYDTGAEANCTSGSPCCRKPSFNSLSPNATISPAPRYGAFLCDTPISLVTAAMEAIPVLTGTEETGFAFTVYTGDLVSHDPDNQLSRSYVEYTETLLYDLLRQQLGSGPTYAVLGNHDSYNQAQDAPHNLSGGLGTQFSWNYDHLASLWQHEEWLPESAVDLAKAHYAAFMVRRQDGLRIISLNTDLWYKYVVLRSVANNGFLTYRAGPTTSTTSTSTHRTTPGMLRFLTDELQDAEDAGDRVWIIGHVLSGWDGTNPLVNPTNLFYQIVDRFSPHVIANIFFGHTHEDQLSIFYANNATNISAENALVASWMGPSITPGSRLNSGFRMYEIDSSVRSSYSFIFTFKFKSDLLFIYPPQTFEIEVGPTFALEYSTRETYGPAVPGWGPNDPLNGTFWHLVTEAMENDSSIVSTFNTLQGKTSVLTKPCTGDCVAAKICYIRSGSAAIAFQNCIPGFGSVQGG